MAKKSTAAQSSAADEAKVEASRQRSDGTQLPSPRQFAPQEIASWIAEDEADLKCFQKDA